MTKASEEFVLCSHLLSSADVTASNGIQPIEPGVALWSEWDLDITDDDRGRADHVLQVSLVLSCHGKSDTVLFPRPIARYWDDGPQGAGL